MQEKIIFVSKLKKSDSWDVQHLQKDQEFKSNIRTINNE